MIFTFPEISPSKCSFKVQPNDKALFSPYNQVEEIWQGSGEKWLVSLLWNRLKRDDGIVLRGHLNTLHGRVNRTKIRDFAHINKGGFAGAPSVATAGQYGLALNVKGFIANSSVAFVGDRFEVSGRLHELTADVISDLSGNATLQVWPEIINSPAINESLITSNPRSKFMMKDPMQIPDFSKSARFFENIRIDFIETLRP